MADGLYNPEGVVLDSPSQVERALGALWQPASDTTDMDHATRVSLGNLVLVGDATRWPEYGSTLAELSPTYPTRTLIVLLEEPGPADMRVSVSALCHVPQPGRPQVCCEQVLLRVPRDRTANLPQTILPLLESDVPTFVWWTIDPTLTEPACSNMRAMADRIIVDAGLAGLTCLDGPGVTEIGWAATSRWRNVLAGVFDDCDAETVANIESIEIRLNGHDESDRIRAIWLAAFVAGQLGWRPREATSPDDWLFDHDDSTAIVSFATSLTNATGMVGMRIVSGKSIFEIESRKGTHSTFRIHVCDDQICSMPRSIQVRPASTAEAACLSMQASATDPVFERALPIARFIAETRT